jgi:hypothetical protein
MVSDLERAWRLPEGTISLCESLKSQLEGLPPRQMRMALIDMLGKARNRQQFVLH